MVLVDLEILVVEKWFETALIKKMFDNMLRLVGWCVCLEGGFNLPAHGKEIIDEEEWGDIGLDSYIRVGLER